MNRRTDRRRQGGARPQPEVELPNGATVHRLDLVEHEVRTRRDHRRGRDRVTGALRAPNMNPLMSTAAVPTVEELDPSPGVPPVIPPR